MFYDVIEYTFVERKRRLIIPLILNTLKKWQKYDLVELSFCLFQHDYKNNYFEILIFTLNIQFIILRSLIFVGLPQAIQVSIDRSHQGQPCSRAHIRKLRWPVLEVDIVVILEHSRPIFHAAVGMAVYSGSSTCHALVDSQPPSDHVVTTILHVAGVESIFECTLHIRFFVLSTSRSTSISVNLSFQTRMLHSRIYVIWLYYLQFKICHIAYVNKLRNHSRTMRNAEPKDMHQWNRVFLLFFNGTVKSDFCILLQTSITINQRIILVNRRTKK